MLTYKELVQAPNFMWKLVIIILKVSTQGKPYTYVRYPLAFIKLTLIKVYSHITSKIVKSSLGFGVAIIITSP